MKKISERMVYDGTWVSLHELSFENKDGVPIVWETVRRKKSTIGVVVVARLMPSKRFVLVKQHRPAIEGYVLAFPAGLSFGDPEHALVELKEETGYSGRIVSVSPVLKAGASLINDSGRVVYVEVDENDPVNRSPRQALEPAEDIQVCLVTREEAVEFFLKEQAAGTHISTNLWYFFALPDVIR